MIRQVTWAGATVLILVAALYPDVAAAHGDAPPDADPCSRRMGESVVHFSAYQPQYELKCTKLSPIRREQGSASGGASPCAAATPGDSAATRMSNVAPAHVTCLIIMPDPPDF